MKFTGLTIHHWCHACVSQFPQAAVIEMLLRCGGNVIEVGRRQVTVVATATLVLLTVAIYSVGFLHKPRSVDGWVK